MSTKAVRLLLMFLFGQVVQTAVMLIGFALDMSSIIWWTVVSGLVPGATQRPPGALLWTPPQNISTDSPCAPCAANL